MSMIEYAACDHCGMKHDTQYALPVSWLVVTLSDGYSGRSEPLHFCCKTCLCAWAITDNKGVVHDNDKTE